MDNLYKTLAAAERAANIEFAEAFPVGDMWAIKPRLYDIEQTANLLNCTTRTIKNMQKDGKLPPAIYPTPGQRLWPLKGLMKLVS